MHTLSTKFPNKFSSTYTASHVSSLGRKQLLTVGFFWEHLPLVGGEGMNHGSIRPNHPTFQPS